MPGRKSTRTSQRNKVKRQPTPGFGELQTTPTSRHLQSPRRGQPQKSTLGLPNQDENPEPASAQLQSRTSTEEFENDVDDLDLIRLATLDGAVPSAQPPPGFSWSEVGSARRSSPLQEEEDRNPSENQESVVDAFSSPTSGPGRLPNTQQLPSHPPTGNLLGKGIAQVDFSETASSARRSSPYYSQAAASQVAVGEMWGFPENNLLPALPSTIPDSLHIPEMAISPYAEVMDHLPEDELYDATPPKSNADHPADIVAPNQGVGHIDPEQLQHPEKLDAPRARAKRKLEKSLTNNKDSLTRCLEDEIGPVEGERQEEQASYSPPETTMTKRQKVEKNTHGAQETSTDEHSTPVVGKTTTTRSGGKGKSGARQRAKPPMQFDERTQRVKEVPQIDSARGSKRMNIVGNLKKSHAASISPIATSVKKATPRSRRKSVSKPVEKVIRRSGLRSAVRQEDPDIEDKEHKKPNPNVRNAQVETKPLPAVRKETTRAKAKEGNSSIPKPKANKNLPEAGKETPGSTNNLIVLSSDSESSSVPDDNGYIPTETSGPAETAPPQELELPVDNLDIPTNPSDSVDYDEEQPIPPTESPKLHRPSVRSEVQPAVLKKTLIVRRDPMDLAKAPSSKNKRDQPVHFGPREAMSARDANDLVQPNASQTKILKRPAMAIDPAMEISRPPRKTSKLSRSFSISQAGSPLPVETLPTHLVDETSPGNMNDIEQTKVLESNTQTAEPRSLQHEYLSSLAAVEPEQEKTRVTLKPKARKLDKVKEAGMQTELQKGEENLHAQILASLQARDEKQSKDRERDHSNMHSNKEVTKKTRPEGPNEEAAEKLHGLVETMLSHLRTKEATIYRGADAYRKNGIDCVGKINRRYTQERQTLNEMCKKDGDRFIRRTREVSAVLEKRGNSRDEAILQLEEMAARRRHLFQQATTSLRALHGRLMNGNMADYED
ncbi:hypothetical protein ACHAP5_007471 [Fusarium lateritium]